MRIWYTGILLILFFGITSVELNAQIIKGEAILGFNLTQVEGDEVHGFKKPGLQVGAGALIPFGKKWDFGLEVLYNQKGAREGQQYLDTVDGKVYTGEYKLRLNYVEVPVMVYFTDKDFITIGAGFSWGRLVGLKEWEHGELVNSTVEGGPYNKNDFNYIIDLRVKLMGPLKLGMRYQNSIVPIRTREFEDFTGEKWTRDQYNKVITLKLVYVFGEQQSQINREVTD